LMAKSPSNSPVNAFKQSKPLNSVGIGFTRSHPSPSYNAEHKHSFNFSLYAPCLPHFLLLLPTTLFLLLLLLLL